MKESEYDRAEFVRRRRQRDFLKKLKEAQRRPGIVEAMRLAEQERKLRELIAGESEGP